MKLVLHILCLCAIAVSCKTPEARKPISVKSGSFINESINRNKQLASKEESKIKQIINSDTTHNYLTSETGFWYYYNLKDSIPTGITPKYGDLVNFDYTVRDLDGGIIYTQKELKTVSYLIDKEELFLGLREGLKLMKEGEVVTFLFPSYHAYGYYGDDNKIGTNIPLIAEVTLNKITKQ